jgi:hypothetical protein
MARISRAFDSVANPTTNPDANRPGVLRAGPGAQGSQTTVNVTDKPKPIGFKIQTVFASDGSQPAVTQIPIFPPVAPQKPKPRSDDRGAGGTPGTLRSVY